MNESEFKKYFIDKDVFTNEDIFKYYKRKEPELLKTTANWRIYHLTRKGVIQRIGKGMYKSGETRAFKPEISMKMKRISNYFKKIHPHEDYCIWNLVEINNIGQHLTNLKIYFFEVDRRLIESTYYELKDKFPQVALNRHLYGGLTEYSEYIIIRPLITESPLQEVQSIKTITLEKFLTDLYSDKEFDMFQGHEMYLIFKNAFDNFTINKTSMLRYAGRKRKKAQLKAFVEEIEKDAGKGF